MDIDLRRQIIYGISRDTTAAELANFFSKFGKVEDVSCNNRTYAFITFASLKVIPPKNHFFQGKKIALRKLEPIYSNAKSKTILVNGILKNVSENTLAAYFSKYGTVTDVRKQRKGKNPRFAYVTFEDYNSVEEAIKKVIHLIDGKNIVDINKANRFH